MGIWDRFGRGADAQSSSAQPLSDEQSIARYRYMLRTARPRRSSRRTARPLLR